MELNRQNLHLAAFLTFSLLLHLLLLYLTPGLRLLPRPATPEPVVVEMRPKAPVLRERELDLPVPPAAEQHRERPARRLGPADQVVERETAPRGEMPEDRAPARPRPPVPLTPARPRPATESQRPPLPAPLPDRQVLMAAATQAAENVAEREIAEWRRKYRADVEQGDAVWLDTEKDLLISFFQRFRTNIYNVWNYPRPAAERGEQGTCLLRIVINRDGTVRAAELKETTGSPELDNEALRAVHKGAPYGPLPAAYEGEALTIFAFFQYRLGGKPFLFGGN